MTQNDSAVVDNLVTQFSSPLHCFRELVQNSIDAGSPTVDVWTEFIEGEGHRGTIALHVDDYGEGMDESLIDNELTRLFASSKEEDLTKIGQFGIGFVSTFALNPDAILVETGRSGEYWEVLFHEDRSFTKTELDVPVEGTQITIFLEGDVHRYNELVDDIFKTLKHWCSHSDTEVTFEDRTPTDGERPELRTINDPFEVDGDCLTSTEHEGTKIVAAYTDDPVYGFYNRGLTLALTKTADEVLGEERAKRFSHIGFKIKSRYLEHTLSRETVMRDANFEKAMKLLTEAAVGPLFDSLVDALEDLVGRGEWSINEMDRYRRLCRFLVEEPNERLAEIADRQILRTVEGGTGSLQEAYRAWRRDGRVLVCEEASELSARLERDGIPIFLGRFTTGNEELGARRPVSTLISVFIQNRHEGKLVNRFRSFLGFDVESETEAAVVDPDRVYLPVTVDPEVPQRVAPLIERAAELLDGIDAGYASLATCTMASPTDSPLFVMARSLDEVMARPPGTLASERGARRPHAAVNRDHPHFRRLAELYRDKPDMAAYCLAKSLLLTEDRLLEADTKLMEAALQADHAATASAQQGGAPHE